MRAVEKKRKPFMTARKWTVIVIAFFIAIIFSIVLYYREIQSNLWDEQIYIKSSLREYFDASTIDYLSKYVWDDVYWIVKGKTTQNIEKYIVWKDLNILLSAETSELLTEKQLLSKLEAKGNNDTVTHIQPAYFRGELAFEVQTISETKHKVYTFYTMSEGKLLDQFTLAK